MKAFVILFFSIFILTTTHAQTLNVNKLDSLFDVLQNRGLASGSLSISINGKTTYQRAIGFTTICSTKKSMPDVNTKYRIGSVSKMFTAAMIFQLIDEKKLRLDEHLAAFFPQLPNAHKITIRQMLYHRSGLHDYTRNTNFPEWMDKPKTHEEMIKIIADKKPDFEPGAKADYSNTNYLLLSYIIEKLHKMSFEQVLKKNITRKTRLQNTYYGKPINIQNNEAASYKYANNTWKLQKETDVSIHCGAGSLVSTPGDLTLFIQNLFTGRIISRSGVDSMITLVDGYGMGLFPYDHKATKGYGHNGRIEEFYTAVRYYPETKLALCYVTNGILYPRTDILEGILKICFNEAYTIPFSKPVVLQPGDLEKYIGTYSTGNLPFKVVCKKQDEKLVFEAGGKLMAVEPVSANYFMNIETGSFFEFNTEKGELQIKETDNVYYLQKEK